MNVYAVISTLNEAETIGHLVRSLRGQVRAQVRDVIVVDGNSSDDTAALARKAGAFVFNNPAPSIRDNLMHGWQMALAHQADAVLQIDAGGSHNSLEAGRLLGLLGERDFVIGSRFMAGSAYAGGRRAAASRLAAAACNVLAGAAISDWTSGYRAMSAEVISYLLSKSYRAAMHGWQIETLAYAVAAGFEIGAVPISYLAGRSSFSPRVAWEAGGVLTRMALT